MCTQGRWTPQSINHRSMQHHYTPPPINHRSMQDHYTDCISHIDVYIDTSADRPHPLLQSTIDLWKTTTPVKTDPGHFNQP